MKYLNGWIIGLILIVTVFAGIFYAASPKWTDTGYITWIGQKTFNGSWDTPYAVTTTSHGVLNLTTLKNPINVNQIGSGITVPPSNGTLVGLKQINCLPGIPCQIMVLNDP